MNQRIDTDALTQTQLYKSLCRVISGRAGEVDWSAFNPDGWHALVTMAHREGIAPLVYWTFDHEGWPSGVTSKAIASLRSAYYTCTAYNALLSAELERVLAAFDDIQVRAIVLKGAALAARLYPEIGLRPMRDIDLLVRHSQFFTCMELLIKNCGYTECAEEPARDFNQIFHHAVCLRRETGPGLTLELHHELIATPAYRYYTSSEWIWGQTETLLLRGKETSMFTLSPTAQLLYAAAHAMMQHGGGNIPMIWLYDMHLILTREKERLDWGLLLTQARESGWSAGLYASLLRVGRDFDSSPPLEVLTTLEQQSDSKTLALVGRKIIPTRTRTQAEWNRLTSLRVAGGARMVAAMIFPSRAYVCKRYNPNPVWLWPLYYPYRWVDILRDGILTLGKFYMSHTK